MITISSSISDIDAIIKNMEVLAPNYQERLRILKVSDLRNLMKNKDLLSLISDTVGKDWEDDTNKLIKKIENKYKVQKFTDIYINSLRCFLIFRILEGQLASSDLEMTKDFANWLFNATYEGSDKKVSWFDVKLNKYFPKTDLPKKFLKLMGNDSSFKITREWLIDNQSFFFTEDTFKPYNELLMDFMAKLAKEEEVDLSRADDIPQENDTDNQNTDVYKSKSNDMPVDKSLPKVEVQLSTNTPPKKMIQVGVDLAGDPIFVEETVKKEVVKQDIPQQEQPKQDIQEEKVVIEQSFQEKIDLPKNEDVKKEPLPWEDDFQVEPIAIEVEATMVEKINLHPAAPAPEPIKVFSKPGSQKPGSFKPGSKPGSKSGGAVLIQSDNFDDDYNVPDYSFDEDGNENSSVTKSSITTSLEQSEMSFVNEVELNLIEAPLNEDGIPSFDEVLKEKNNLDQKIETEAQDAIALKNVEIGERLFENGMTNKSSTLKEMENEKDEEIRRMNELMAQKDNESIEIIEKNNLSSNSIFMSIKKRDDEKNMD